MRRHRDESGPLLLADKVFKHLLSLAEVLLPFIRAFIKEDAQKAVLLPTELVARHLNNKTDIPDLIVLVDDCLLVSIDMQTGYYDKSLLLRGSTYSMDLFLNQFKKGDGFDGSFHPSGKDALHR